MVAAVAAVAVVASWDADREAARALGDFAAEQATLARALGAVVRVSAGGDARQVLGELNAVPRPADTVVLVRRAGAVRFLGPGGREVDAPPVAEAFARGDTVARLSRPEAAQIGLPTRTAWAGLARVDGGAARGAGRSPRSPAPSGSAIASARRRAGWSAASRSPPCWCWRSAASRCGSSARSCCSSASWRSPRCRSGATSASSGRGGWRRSERWPSAWRTRSRRRSG